MRQPVREPAQGDSTVASDHIRLFQSPELADKVVMPPTAGVADHHVAFR